MGDDLIAMCRNGDRDAVRAALAADPGQAARADASGETPLMAALYRGHRGVVEVLVDAGAPLDLHAAAALDRVDRVEPLLAADRAGLRAMSYDGWTPLHLAAFFGAEGAAGALIQAGADVNALSTNGLRNTPLHAALAGGHEAIALRLIEAGADVAATDAGRHTPLHLAAENGLVRAVRALLARGADPLAVDAEDQTPLSRAAARNHNAVIDAINLSH
jgi:ankyrin repeat protein